MYFLKIAFTLVDVHNLEHLVLVAFILSHITILFGKWLVPASLSTLVAVILRTCEGCVAFTSSLLQYSLVY